MVAHCQCALGGSAFLCFLTRALCFLSSVRVRKHSFLTRVMLACSTSASATNEPLQVGYISNKNHSLCSHDNLDVMEPIMDLQNTFPIKIMSVDSEGPPIWLEWIFVMLLICGGTYVFYKVVGTISKVQSLRSDKDFITAIFITAIQGINLLAQLEELRTEPAAAKQQSDSILQEMRRKQARMEAELAAGQEEITNLREVINGLRRQDESPPLPVPFVPISASQYPLALADVRDTLERMQEVKELQPWAKAHIKGCDQTLLMKFLSKGKVTTLAAKMEVCTRVLAALYTAGATLHAGKVLTKSAINSIIMQDEGARIILQAA